MTDLDISTPSTPRLDEAAIRAFVDGRASSLTDETRQRYQHVLDRFFEFLDVVDARPWLGHEIGEHLETARREQGPGTFLATLGPAGVLRVLPAFLADPWLSPAGTLRRTHRAVAEQVLRALRRTALPDSGMLRDDFGRVRRAIGTARARDYGWAPRVVHDDDPVTLTVTFSIRSSRLDDMLDEVESGRHDSLADALSDWLDPRSSVEPWSEYARCACDACMREKGWW